MLDKDCFSDLYSVQYTMLLLQWCIAGVASPWAVRDPQAVILQPTDHHSERRLTDFCFSEMVFHPFGSPYLVEDVLETSVVLIYRYFWYSQGDVNSIIGPLKPKRPFLRP